jgi:hypothetical protein
MACLLKNEPASYALWPPRLSNERLWSRSESESEQGARSEGVDPKPRDLSMVSVKRA